MKHTDVRALSRFVYALVSAVFVLNLLVLPLVPGMVAMKGDGLKECGRLSQEMSLPAPVVFLLVCWQYLWRIWRMGSYDVVLTVFLLFCGGCTAVILWQGRRVLGTIARQTPFCRENGVSLRRAAVCCFLIYMVLPHHPAAAHLQRPVCAPVFDGGASVYGHVRPLPSGRAAQGRERPDHLRGAALWQLS